MTTIVTKWVDRGSLSFYGSVISGSASTSFGTISNTQNGSRDLNIDSLYSGADVISLTHNSGTGTLTFSLTGIRANSGWATISIGGTSFSRSAATYSTSGGNSYWNWSLSLTPFGSSNGIDKEIIWDDGGTTVNAPTASSVIITGGADAQENTTATVNLSNTGSGGTLEYACEVGDTTPDNWQSSNTFTISRGSGTVYARARRSSSTNSNVVNTSQAAFLIGDSSFSRTSPTITSSASSATTTIQYATSGETLAIRVDGQSTNLVTAVVASSSSSQNISFSSSLPSGGNSETYRFFVRRPTSTGGDGTTFNSTGMTFTVTRTAAAVAPAAPTNLTFSTATTASASTSVTVTASGGGTGTLKVSPDGSTWSANGTTFTSRARGSAHTWYARVESTLNSSNYTEAHTPPYLDPATGTAANDTILSGASSHTASISGGAAGTVYEFRSGSHTGTILANVNGNGSVSCSGGAGTYYVTHYKTTGTGGSGTAGRANLTTYTVTAVSKRTFTIKINYIPAETGTPPTLLGPTVTVDVGSTTGSPTSSTNPLEVSVGDDVIWKKNLVQNTVTVYGLNDFTSNSNIAVTVPGVTRTLANGSNGADQITVLVSGGSNGEASAYYHIERVGGITPPSGLSASLGGNESQTETVTLNLSTSGSAGTLEYLQRTSTVMSSTGWQTSNQFSQARNTTRYYYASRNRNSDSFTNPLTVTVNYLGAVTTGYSFDTASGNIGYGDGAPAISFTAAQANHTVAVFEGSTARSSGVTGTTDHNNIATNEVPPAGGSNTYNLRTYRNQAAGGNPSPTYVATNASTITIKRYPQTPTLGYSDNSQTVESPTTSATLTLTNTDGASTYWFRRVNDGTAFGDYVEDSNNVVTYADQTRAANQAYDYQGRIIGGNGLVSESAVINAQQLTKRYLDPKPFSYSTPATISYTATSHVLTITGAEADHTYGWGIGVVGKGTAAHSGSSTVTISSNSALPQPGEQNNYVVSVRRGTASGGQNNLVSQTTPVNVKRYPQAPSGLTTFTDGGTEAASGTFTIAVGNLDGATATAPTLSTSITLSPDYTTNAVANGSAIASVVRAGDIVYARNTGSNGLTASAAIATPATYLLPNTPSLPNVSNAYNTANHSVDITSMPTTVYYEVRTGSYTGTQRGASTTGGGGSSKSINVTQINTGGDTVTYYVRGYRLATAGGDEQWDNLGTYTVTEAGNTAASAFTFNPNSPVGVGLSQISNLITIAGLSPGTSANFSITGGTYSKNGAPDAYTNGTAVNGDTFRVKHTSSSSYSTSVTTTLTVGGTSGSFVSTTGDITPTAFSFTDKTGNASTEQNSYAQITGINLATTVSRTSGGATFAVVGTSTTPSSSNFGTSTTTITNNQYLHVKQTTSSTYNAVLETVMNVGGITDTWVVTTNPAPSDGTPESYSFTDVTTALSTVAYAATQITGISQTITVSRTSGAAVFAISNSGTTTPNSSGFTSSNKTLTNNQYIWLRQTSSSSNSTTLTSQFSAGGVSASWNLTTVAASSSSGTGYGLQIFPPTGTIARLDTTDRTVRALAVFTGTLAAGGSSSTFTQTGYSSSDTTIAVEWQTSGDPQYVSLSSSGTSLTITRANDPSSFSNTYQVRIFRV